MPGQERRSSERRLAEIPYNGPERRKHPRRTMDDVDGAFPKPTPAYWRGEVLRLEEALSTLSETQAVDAGESDLRARLSWARANANLYGGPRPPLRDAGEEALRLAYLETSMQPDDDEANAILAEIERRGLKAPVS